MQYDLKLWKHIFLSFSFKISQIGERKLLQNIGGLHNIELPTNKILLVNLSTIFDKLPKKCFSTHFQEDLTLFKFILLIGANFIEDIFNPDDSRTKF